MQREFHPAVKKYLTLFSKNQLSHTQKFKGNFKVEFEKKL